MLLTQALYLFMLPVIVNSVWQKAELPPHCLELVSLVLALLACELQEDSD